MQLVLNIGDASIAKFHNQYDSPEFPYFASDVLNQGKTYFFDVESQIEADFMEMDIQNEYLNKYDIDGYFELEGGEDE